MSAVDSLRESVEVRFGDGPTSATADGGESPLLYDFMTLGQRTKIAIFEMAHEGHDVEISPYWLLDLRTMYEVEAYCTKCRMSMHLNLHGEEVKHA